MPLFGGVEIVGHPDLNNIRKLDLLAIPPIRRIQRLGFAIDVDYCHRLTSDFDREMRELEYEISSYVPKHRLHEFVDKSATQEDEEETDESSDDQTTDDITINAASAEQIGKLLFEILGVGAGKELKRTKTGDRISTGKAQLRDLELEHPIVPKILAFRERHKLKNTYSKALPMIARWHPRSMGKHLCPECELNHIDDSWRVHTEIAQTRAVTGRLCSRKPNLSNIPQRTELGSRVRAAFIASTECKLVGADFSQVELRMMAHLANCLSMLAVYLADGDIHVETAMSCFGITDPKKLDKISHRIPAKTANFLVQYGGQAKALYAQLVMAFLILISEKKLDKMPDWLDVAWCEQFIQMWFGARPEVEAYLDLQEYRGRRYKHVWDIFGRVRQTPEMRSCHKWVQLAGRRQAGNLADQSSCAGLMKLALAAVDEKLKELHYSGGIWCWPIVPVHDQLLVEVEERYAEDIREIVTSEFDNVVQDRETGEQRLRVPIKSDGEVLERWLKPEEHQWNSNTGSLERVVKKAA